MHCTVCNTELEDCTCPDLGERMRRLTDRGSPVTSRWCARCDQHYARCTCSEPIWKLRWDGELIDHPSVEAFNQ